MQMKPVAWMVGDSLDADPTQCALVRHIWTREPDATDREYWKQIGVNLTVTPLYIQPTAEQLAQAVLEERERCAALCEGQIWDDCKGSAWNDACQSLAMSIRAGEQ